MQEKKLPAKDKMAKKPLDDHFKIYVDQLKNGHIEEIDEEFSPEFIGIAEDGLAFRAPVFVKGQAYLADNELMLRLNVSTEATMPCAICNVQVVQPIMLKDMYEAIPLQEIPSGIFSLVEPLREAILLETPAFVECNNGDCPERKHLEKFLKKQPSSMDADQTHYRPFEGLKSDDEGV